MLIIFKEIINFYILMLNIEHYVYIKSNHIFKNLEVNGCL